MSVPHLAAIHSVASPLDLTGAYWPDIKVTRHRVVGQHTMPVDADNLTAGSIIIMPIPRAVTHDRRAVPRAPAFDRGACRLVSGILTLLTYDFCTSFDPQRSHRPVHQHQPMIAVPIDTAAGHVQRSVYDHDTVRISYI